MLNNNGHRLGDIQVAEATTLRQKMDAFDRLHPRLRCLVNYAPGRLSPIDLLPGNRDLHGAEAAFWAAFPTWTPIERDPLRRLR